MATMKTLKFPGSNNVYEMVDATARAGVASLQTTVGGLADDTAAASAAASSALTAASSALANFAGAFSASTAYTAGQYVTYTDGQFYRFTTNHAAGAWNSAHVVAVTVGEEVSDLESALTNILDYDTPAVLTESTTAAAASTTQYEIDIPKYSNCVFKNVSSNAAMVLYAVKDGVTTTLTPNGVAKGNKYTFIASENYDHIKVYVNNTDLSFTFTATPALHGLEAVNYSVFLDSFDGTDTEKLQQCFDACVQGGTILLNRPVTLTSNITIKHNSDLDTLITVIGISMNSVINCGTYGFIGQGTGHTNHIGGVQFIGVTFAGTGTLIDGATLIRVFLTSCICYNFFSVCDSGSLYMQSIYITNCYIRGCSHVINATDRTTENAYDIRLTNNVIERCVNVVTVGRCFDVIVNNNLIEGCKGTPIIIYSICKMFIIRDNYFELNGDTPAQVSNNCTLMNAYYQVDSSDQWVEGVRNIIFESNVIHQNAEDICIKIPPRVFDGTIVIKNNCCNSGYLVYNETTTTLTNIIYEFNTGDYVDTHSTINVVTPALYNALFS